MMMPTRKEDEDDWKKDLNLDVKTVVVIINIKITIIIIIAAVIIMIGIFNVTRRSRSDSCYLLPYSLTE